MKDTKDFKIGMVNALLEQLGLEAEDLIKKREKTEFRLQLTTPSELIYTEVVDLIELNVENRGVLMHGGRLYELQMRIRDTINDFLKDNKIDDYEMHCPQLP